MWSVSMLIGNAPARNSRPSAVAQHAVLDHAAAAEQAHVVLEAIQVALGLEADEVVEASKPSNKHFVVRQRGEQVRRRHRHVQEEADAAADAEFAQPLRERDQVVVVHPDDVVLAQQRRELLGEQRIDAAIARRSVSRL